MVFPDRVDVVLKNPVEQKMIFRKFHDFRDFRCLAAQARPSWRNNGESFERVRFGPTKKKILREKIKKVSQRVSQMIASPGLWQVKPVPTLLE